VDDFNALNRHSTLRLNTIQFSHRVEILIIKLAGGSLRRRNHSRVSLRCPSYRLRHLLDRHSLLTEITIHALSRGDSMRSVRAIASNCHTVRLQLGQASVAHVLPEL